MALILWKVDSDVVEVSCTVAQTVDAVEGIVQRIVRIKGENDPGQIANH